MGAFQDVRVLTSGLALKDINRKMKLNKITIRVGHLCVDNHNLAIIMLMMIELPHLVYYLIIILIITTMHVT